MARSTSPSDRYFYLGSTYAKGEKRIEQVDAAKGLRLDLLAGKRLDQAGVSLRMVDDSEKPQQRDWIASGAFVVVSDGLKDLISEWEPAYTEFFPATVRHESDGSERQMWLLNLLAQVDGIDLEASDLDFWSTGTLVSELRRLALAPSKIGNRHLFRLSQYPVEIFVSEALKEAMEAKDFAGISFHPSEALSPDTW
jgi:hypothetical protein